MAVYSFHHSRLGNIIIHTRRNAAGVRVAWRKGELIATIPTGLPVDTLNAALDRMADRVIAKRPAGQSFHEGRIIEIEPLKITLRRQSVKPSSILFNTSRSPEIEILAGDTISWSDTPIITAALNRVAKFVAPDLLLPRLTRLAEIHGLKPSAMKISHGQNVLGTCSRAGVISLSTRVVWLTPELRDYIICHELAHLVHHNHSAAFHDVCNRLTGGREKELQKRLKNYVWPF